MAIKKISILLIDDSEPDNYLHEYLLKKLEEFGPIYSVLNVEKAIETLVQLSKKEEMPNIIMLDINMPRMNGWDFLDHSLVTKDYDISKSDVYMLTTSLNPDDKKKALEAYNLKGFFNKPLKLEYIQSILTQFD
jgi:CheY-like chemotaxis protein